MNLKYSDVVNRVQSPSLSLSGRCGTRLSRTSPQPSITRKSRYKLLFVTFRVLQLCKSMPS
jgi:hypothetical protein